MKPAPLGARSGRDVVLVDQAAEPVAPLNRRSCRPRDETKRGSPAVRGREVQGAMRSVPVVVIDEHPQHVLQLAAAEDQGPVEALAAHGADKALGGRVRLRGLDRGAHDLDTFASEDLVEGARELAVAIVDQEAQGASRSGTDHARFRACWATQVPLGVGVKPARWTRRLASSMKKST
jgi:hypothetical protein